MMAAAAFQATYFTHKPIVTRKCVQLVFEVPEERLLDVLRMLQPAAGEQQVNVAIARLTPSPASDRAGEDHVERTSPAASPKKAWPDKTAAEQAGILCAEWRFQRFMCADSEDEAARRVRAHCGVESRRDLDKSQRARVLWHGLDNDFRVSIGQMAAPR